MTTRKAAAEAPIDIGMCRVRRVAPGLAVCVVNNPECHWATPYGNYCEHPLVQQLMDDCGSLPLPAPQ